MFFASGSSMTHYILLFFCYITINRLYIICNDPSKLRSRALVPRANDSLSREKRISPRLWRRNPRKSMLQRFVKSLSLSNPWVSMHKTLPPSIVPTSLRGYVKAMHCLRSYVKAMCSGRSCRPWHLTYLIKFVSRLKSCTRIYSWHPYSSPTQFAS